MLHAAGRGVALPNEQHQAFLDSQAYLVCCPQGGGIKSLVALQIGQRADHCCARRLCNPSAQKASSEGALSGGCVRCEDGGNVRRRGV